MNQTFDISSTEYTVYYNDISKYYRIEDISENIITVNTNVESHMLRFNKNEY
jgi:hypothetical protein